MPEVHLICPACEGQGFIEAVMPETLRDPVRNVFRGCSSCGGVGTKVNIPKEFKVSDDVRAFYDSGKSYKSGSGMVVVEYEYVAGECAHCGGEKCEKCYQTGKNVRFIRQSPYNKLLSDGVLKILSFLFGGLVGLLLYLLWQYASGVDL